MSLAEQKYTFDVDVWDKVEGVVVRRYYDLTEEEAEAVQAEFDAPCFDVVVAHGGPTQ